MGDGVLEAARWILEEVAKQSDENPDEASMAWLKNAPLKALSPSRFGTCLVQVANMCHDLYLNVSSDAASLHEIQKIAACSLQLCLGALNRLAVVQLGTASGPSSSRPILQHAVAPPDHITALCWACFGEPQTAR